MTDSEYKRARWIFPLIGALLLSFYFVWMLESQPHARVLTTRPLWFAIGLALCSFLFVFGIFFALRSADPSILILVFGGITLFFIPIFSPIDEHAHFSYIHHWVHHQKLPLLNDPIDPAIFELAPQSRGRSFTTLEYEAFQPPLYYWMARWIYRLAPSSLATKVIFLRATGILCLGVGFLLISSLLPKTWTSFCLCAGFALCPGLLLRMITISNFHLGFLLSCCFSLLIQKWIAQKQSILVSTLAFFTGGLMFMTQLLNVMVVPILSFLGIKTRNWKGGLLGLVLGLSLISPWIIFNLNHYGSWNAGSQAQLMQQPAINPHHETYRLTSIVSHLPRLMATFWNPEEVTNPLGNKHTSYLTSLMLTALLTAGLCGAIFLMIRGILQKRPAPSVLWIGLFFFASNFGLLIAFTILKSWHTLLGRHLYYSVPFLIPLLFQVLKETRPSTQRVVSTTFLLLILFSWASFLLDTIPCFRQIWLRIA